VKLEVTVGGEEFWHRFRSDIREAERSVLVQTLSWEGDSAGLGLAEELGRAAAPDRRVLVDAYTRYVMSDRLLLAPTNLLDPSLRREARETGAMVKRLSASGAAVRVTNPPGLLLHRFAARNHKKLALVDDRIAYLGGINFSDHNFAWHDMMLRFEDDRLAAFLADDFDTTWRGTDQASADSFHAIFRVLEAAEHEIHVHSPYPGLFVRGWGVRESWPPGAFGLIWGHSVAAEGKSPPPPSLERRRRLFRSEVPAPVDYAGRGRARCRGEPRVG
jgi:phosphatidylserine/phosphatidylglycerophosphate/cardiolipin synthase-like enzyme